MNSNQRFFEEQIPYGQLMQSRRFGDAGDEAIRLLSSVRAMSRSSYQRSHKGTPFYFLGICAFACHDYPTAAFFFDAAMDEDVKNQPDNLNTPAQLFFRLDTNNDKQAGLEIVRRAASTLESLIWRYNRFPGSKTSSLIDLRQRFLAYAFDSNVDPSARRLVASLISFVLEFEHKFTMLELTESSTYEPFFTHLFRGCLLFESLLKENPTKTPKGNTLRPVIRDLKQELGLDRDIVTKVTRFENVVALVKGRERNRPIEDAIEITCKTRNTLGHNTAWNARSLKSGTYLRLGEAIAGSILHAISSLYPNNQAGTSP